jgi:hypothetical protein
MCFSAKADIKLNDRNQLVLRYNRQNFNGKNNENNGPLSAEEHSGDSPCKERHLFNDPEFHADD